MKKVVGDALAAPFSKRPAIIITDGYDSATNTFCGGSTCQVTVSATAPNGASAVGIGSIKLYANGDLVDQIQGNSTTLTLSTGLLNALTYPGNIEVNYFTTTTKYNDLTIDYSQGTDCGPICRQTNVQRVGSLQ